MCDFTHVSIYIFKSNKIQITKEKNTITFRIEGLGCLSKGCRNDVFAKSLKKSFRVEFETLKRDSTLRLEEIT